MRPLLQSIWKKLTRFVVRCASFHLPAERRLQIERRVRGREQFKKLRRADVVVVSFGKSGRTWLRVMLSRFYQVRFGLSERHLVGFDNLHYKNRSIPKVFFTHDNYTKDYTGNRDNKSDYVGKKVVLLVRHPGDVAVSQYHQWQHRMKPNKKVLNSYPPHGTEVSMFEFLTQWDVGLKRAIDFMNGWAAEFPRLEDLLVVRYEDLRARPEETLAGLLEFLGMPGTQEEVAEAVSFADFENMKKMEQKRTFWLSGGRMVPRDRGNPSSFKVRRGKVAGYRDYFDDAENAEIDAIIRDRLSPEFGYAVEEAAAARPATA